MPRLRMLVIRRVWQLGLAVVAIGLVLLGVKTFSKNHMCRTCERVAEKGDFGERESTILPVKE